MHKYLKIGGIAATVAGAAMLYIGGTGEAQVSALVGGVFVLAGVIAQVIKGGDK